MQIHRVVALPMLARVLFLYLCVCVCSFRFHCSPLSLKIMPHTQNGSLHRIGIFHASMNSFSHLMDRSIKSTANNEQRNDFKVKFAAGQKSIQHTSDGMAVEMPNQTHTNRISDIDWWFFFSPFNPSLFGWHITNISYYKFLSPTTDKMI